MRSCTRHQTTRGEETDSHSKWHSSFDFVKEIKQLEACCWASSRTEPSNSTKLKNEHTLSLRNQEISRPSIFKKNKKLRVSLDRLHFLIPRRTVALKTFWNKKQKSGGILTVFQNDSAQSIGSTHAEWQHRERPATN